MFHTLRYYFRQPIDIRILNSLHSSDNIYKDIEFTIPSFIHEYFVFLETVAHHIFS